MKKINQFIKDNYLWIIAIVSGPIIINLVILMPSIPWITSGDSTQWLGFFGNYSGGIIGGVVAYLVAKRQIDELKYQEEKKTNLSMRPYLRAIGREKPQNADLFNKNLIAVQFKGIDSGKELIVGRCDFLIENVGLGTAVDVWFSFFLNMTITDRDKFTLTIKESREIKIIADVQINNPKNIISELFVSFKDLLGNEYEQTIIIQINHSSETMISMDAKNATAPILTKKYITGP